MLWDVNLISKHRDLGLLRDQRSLWGDELLNTLSARCLMNPQNTALEVFLIKKMFWAIHSRVARLWFTLTYVSACKTAGAASVNCSVSSTEEKSSFVVRAASDNPSIEYLQYGKYASIVTIILFHYRLVAGIEIGASCAVKCVTYNLHPSVFVKVPCHARDSI